MPSTVLDSAGEMVGKTPSLTEEKTEIKHTLGIRARAGEAEQGKHQIWTRVVKNEQRQPSRDFDSRRQA